ncbi:MAG: DUF1980 domain-containing protein [Verrucomicrobiales bacterium]|nr:DUF1980 domain-containing protein [Verrucomicrobiales bacterium]
MKKFLQLLAILTLMIWGGLFLYFYGSGRIEKYLDPSFRIYALISGIGFILLGAFNFIHRNRAVGVCTHDHAHGDACDHDHHHDHAPEQGHTHEHHHDHGCCDHDDEPEKMHAHAHVHEHHGCCDHDHDHDHERAPVHSHDHEETPSGMAFSLLVLLVPLLAATAYSKDAFSSEYVAKWGKIERQMQQQRIAQARASQPESPDATPVTNPYTSDGIEAAEGDAGSSTPYPGQADTPPAPKDDKAAEAWGAFTMEDLKKMVPQNAKGEFLIDVPQIFYTAGDKELMDVMEGIPVETTAQLMEETLHNPNNTRLKAFRLFIECCAADARPLSVPVDFGKAPPEYTEMGWYKLYGKLHYAKENEEIIPMIRIERIEATSEPTDGLLF